MLYFFPDSQDLVDPSFDFRSERRSEDRVRHRDDRYAHEVFSAPICDGLLVSKGIVDGIQGSAGRYTIAQRHRLLRVGVREFFRLDGPERPYLPVIGDCGAFTYVGEPEPPYSVDELLRFYVDCGFDLGISLDHVILAYKPQWDRDLDGVPDDVRRRQDLTLELAADFLKKHRQAGLGFVPLGVAQGWSPRSYARAVNDLQKMGYDYIAIGGMVPLKTRDILASLTAVNDVRLPSTRLHLLGITRTEAIAEFERLGAASFDSTSPLRQAFKDDRDNYYGLRRKYTAVPVPQVEGNSALRKKIQAGQVSQDVARRLERRCLELLEQYDRECVRCELVLEALAEYEAVHSPGADFTALCRDTLVDRPWADCDCEICRRLGIHVVLFRGAERNRRRGLHNVWVFYRRMKGQPLERGSQGAVAQERLDEAGGSERLHTK